MASARRFVRVSTPAGHFSVPVNVAERAGSSWRVLKQDAVDERGRLIPMKPRADVEDAPKPRKKAAPKLRDDSAAATPTPTNPDTSGTSEESE